MVKWKEIKDHIREIWKRRKREKLDPNVIAGDSSGVGDPLIWYRDIGKHCFGDFSMAVAKANEVIEDHSEMQARNGSVFVGVYDGHGGNDASRFIIDHFYSLFMRISEQQGGISRETLRNAVLETEEAFMGLVNRAFGIKPEIAGIGSCCLVGVIYRKTLFIANVGDSRAVMGSTKITGKMKAKQLTNDHNPNIEKVRDELEAMHPDDTQIVVQRQGVWRVKGIIQISRSIGDAHLKKPEYAFGPNYPRFHLERPIRRAVLSAEPSMTTRSLKKRDKFVIFASDGLWELLTNEQAVKLVRKHPRAGIARRLAKTALNVAAKNSRMTYNELRRVPPSSRRCYHDDITVVVIFIDHKPLVDAASVPELAVRGFADDAGPSGSGPPDAGPSGSGPPDAGPSDAGPSDAAPPDAGPSDAAPSDAAPSDAAPSDAGPSGSGPSDAEPSGSGPSGSGPTGSGSKE